MKILFKHFAKHKLLLVRSFKAIGVNLFKLFLIDKLSFLLPARFRNIFKILCMFGAKFTLISSLFGIIYSITAEIFNWTFNYKTIIDLILGLVLSYETGLLSELKFLWSYYYTKFFDWWISKIESSDKEKAKSLRQRIFTPTEPVEIPPVDPKEQAKMEKEYVDKIQKRAKELKETWHERMEREIREMHARNKSNVNINITPDYHNTKPWISYNTLKWLMYALLGAGLLYSYYYFLNEINTFFHTQFINLYNSVKDVFTHPGTYLASIGSYLWLNTKSIVKNYIFRKVWPLSLLFKPKGFTKDEINDKINDPDYQQGEDNFPSSSMRDLIHSDMPDINSTEDEDGKIVPKYDSTRYKEEMEKVVSEQGRVSKRWNETDEDYVERKHRIEIGNVKAGDTGSVSETLSEAKERLFASPSVEEEIEEDTQETPSLMTRLEESRSSTPVETKDKGKPRSVGESSGEGWTVERSNLYYTANLTDRQYFATVVQPVLENFMESNEDSQDPKIKAFKKWFREEASNLEIEIVIGRRLPNFVTDEFLDKEFVKAACEILNIEPHDKIVERYNNLISK